MLNAYNVTFDAVYTYTDEYLQKPVVQNRTVSVVLIETSFKAVFEKSLGMIGQEVTVSKDQYRKSEETIDVTLAEVTSIQAIS